MKKAWLLLLLPACGFAQPASTATLSGTVTDRSSGIVVGAAVHIANQETGLERQAATDSAGFYRFDLLPPGTYDLRAEQKGFSPAIVTGLPLLVGNAGTRNIVLEVAGAAEAVAVTAEVPPVETTRSQQSNVIEQRAISGLPIDRRDYLSFALLAPGVSDSKALADANTFRVRQTPDSGLSFYGSNGRGNTINVDGGESNDGGGGVRPTVGQEAVREFQVNRSNYSAEYGGSRGGVVNIVTKAGTNRPHGSLFGFFRDQTLDATNPFDYVLNPNNTLARVKPTSTRQQFGAAAGGPVVKDKTFYFLDYEQERRRESTAVPILTNLSVFGPTPQQQAILSQLPAAAAAQLTAALSTPPAIQRLFQINSGIFPFRTDQYQGMLRVDHQPNQNNQFSFRSNTSKVYDTNPNVLALTGYSRGYVQNIFDTTASASWFHTFTPRFINEARAQFNFDDQLTASNEKFGPALELAGYGNFNRDRFLPSEEIVRRYELSDNLTFTLGRHSLKTGAYVLIRNEHVDSATFFSGRFTFGPLPGSIVSPVLASTAITSLQALNLGLAQSYQQGFGNGVVKATYPLYAGFVQDEWRVTPSLTLNAGLRYEVDTRHAPLPTDHKEIAPRFGFAWSPDTKNVIRGGYGIYHATIDFQIDYVVDALGVTAAGYRPIAQVLTTIQTAGAQSAANIFSRLVAEGVIGIPSPTRSITPADLNQFGINISHTGPLPPLSVIFSASPRYKNPQTQQASLGIQRDFGRGFTASANGIFVRGSHLTDAYDNNLLSNAPFDPSTGTQNYGPDAAHPFGYFVNPLIYQSNVYESESNSFYGGLLVEAGHRLGRGVLIDVNYTWSHAIDETTDYNSDFEPNNQFCRRCDRASSSFDERHKLAAYAVLQSPSRRNALTRNWIFSSIYQIHSRQPFNLLVGGDDINGDRHNTTDRPPRAGRNTGVGPSFQTFGSRLERGFTLTENMHLDLMLEAFNLFNKLNYRSVNNIVGRNFAGPFAVTGEKNRAPTDPLGFTAAFEPRRLQLGFRLTF
jgi:Carboxypeptidase regulatory-like domain/TonB dependent receptor